MLSVTKTRSNTGTEYKTSRRPLIDSVRSNLQALLERAAEVDSEKLFNVIKSDDDSKTTSQQGNNSSSSSVQIEMGTITTATTSGSLNNNDQSETFEFKSSSGTEMPEMPLDL